MTSFSPHSRKTCKQEETKQNKYYNIVFLFVVLDVNLTKCVESEVHSKWWRNEMSEIGRKSEIAHERDGGVGARR